jgi:pimeloyl-ACP methyl ester carboxylesterase
MADALPDARVAMFEESSHVPHYEEPEAYIETVAAFLDGHRDR